MQNKIAIVFDCPLSATEESVFKGCLEEARILSYKSFFLVPEIKLSFEYLYEGKGKNKKPTTELIKLRDALKDRLLIYNASCVISIGEESLVTLINKYSSTKWRGSIVESPFGKVVPTIHPSTVIKNWKDRVVVISDLRRVLKESATHEYTPPDITLYIKPTLSAIRKYIEDCTEEVSFDIETESDQITCIGLSNSVRHSMCVPFWFGNSGSLWSEQDEQEIWSLIKGLLENGKVEKIAQNGMYDCDVLKRVYGIEVKNFAWDTMLMSHTLNPELPKGLDFITSIYTDISYYKDKIKTDKMDEYFEYNAKDAVATYQIYLKQKEELKGADLDLFYRNNVHALIEPLSAMIETGVKFDVERKKEVKQILEKEVEQLQEDLENSIGHAININSPKQMQEWLYVELKLPVKKKLRKGKAEPTISTDADTLEELYAKSKNKDLKTVLEIREKKKILSTYLEIELDKDDRIRCSYNIAGTETGRLSSSATARGTGTNLQNIPSGVVKSLFIADSGYTFINADYSQAEARVVAHLAEELRLIKVFDEGGDIHRKNASAIFGVTEKDVTDEQRYLAKRIVHASNYGMGARTFAKNIKCTEQEAQKLLFKYFSTYPRIKLWHANTADQLKKARVLRNSFGRRRYFFSRWDDSMVKEGLAYVPQSTVADIVNQAIVSIYKKIKGNQDIQLLLQVHDSILAQVKDEFLEEYCRMISQEMKIPITIKGRTFTIPVDINVGKNWNDLKKFTT